MDLKEKAIEKYKKERELAKENEIMEAENFAEKSLVAIKDIIGNDYGNITVADKMAGRTDFNVDGLLFRVTRPTGYAIIDIVHKCERCGVEISDRVINLKDIGRALVEPHDKFDCDRAVELKKQAEDQKKRLILNTDQKLLEALRDFVRENDEMCSGF